MHTCLLPLCIHRIIERLMVEGLHTVYFDSQVLHIYPSSYQQCQTNTLKNLCPDLIITLLTLDSITHHRGPDMVHVTEDEAKILLKLRNVDLPNISKEGKKPLGINFSLSQNKSSLLHFFVQSLCLFALLFNSCVMLHQSK